MLSTENQILVEEDEFSTLLLNMGLIRNMMMVTQNVKFVALAKRKS